MLFLAGFCLVARTEYTGFYGVGNTGDGLSLQQSTAFGFLFQPFAAGHERDVALAEHLTLAAPYLCREVVVGTIARQVLALSA